MLLAQPPTPVGGEVPKEPALPQANEKGVTRMRPFLGGETGPTMLCPHRRPGIGPREAPRRNPLSATGSKGVSNESVVRGGGGGGGPRFGGRRVAGTRLGEPVGVKGPPPSRTQKPAEAGDQRNTPTGGRRVGDPAHHRPERRGVKLRAFASPLQELREVLGLPTEIPEEVFGGDLKRACVP